ncbi:MAG: diaminopimelate epimerase [Desulfobulbaceae bacterium]|nr:MAG: diaminopimelate epimerase [Desulfobulbaceae bacterium]
MNYPIKFTKMSGAGNDFILIDHRESLFADTAAAQSFARTVCERKFSVGADGLILIENSWEADFSWQFFNADGSIADMCGNGARCAARFAHAHGIAPARLSFATRVGIVAAEVTGATVCLTMTPPRDLRLGLRFGQPTDTSTDTSTARLIAQPTARPTASNSLPLRPGANDGLPPGLTLINLLICSLAAVNSLVAVGILIPH